MNPFCENSIACSDIYYYSLSIFIIEMLVPICGFCDQVLDGFRVVEGSNDGGASWQVLDRQTSQLFKSRFQRMTFMIKSTGFQSNAFRYSHKITLFPLQRCQNESGVV